MNEYRISRPGLYRDADRSACTKEAASGRQGYYVQATGAWEAIQAWLNEGSNAACDAARNWEPLDVQRWDADRTPERFTPVKDGADVRYTNRPAANWDDPQ